VDAQQLSVYSSNWY